MVKRQTVWLSTMMVLSLMLIGYYTVNNGAGSGTSSTTGTDSITTAEAPAGNSTSTSTNSTSSASSGQANTVSSQKSGQTVDWFAESKTTQQQKFAQQDEVYKTIISSDRSTNAQVVQAQQADNQLTAIEGAVAQAQDAVLAEGFSDCVIFPTTDPKTGQVTKVSVYVQTNNLTSDQAVKVMNVVSQNMGISINNIVVHEHQ